MNLYFPCLLFPALLRDLPVCAPLHISLVLDSSDLRVQELYANAPNPLITQKCLDSNTSILIFILLLKVLVFSLCSSNSYPILIISSMKRY